MTHLLSGKNILITRPQYQSQELGNLVKQLGATPIFFPTIEILPVNEPNYFKTIADQLTHYQIVIFTSANAVRFALPFWKLPIPHLKIMAVGPGTAKELNKFNLQTVVVPKIHNSEGILELPILKSVTQKNIAIFCGENPRPLLKQELLNRGATVTEVYCYRRQAPRLNLLELEKIKHLGIYLIISTSLESLVNLQQLFAKIDENWLQKTSLLVISSSMQLQAQQWGIKNIFLANGASNAAIDEKLREIARH